MRRAPSLVAGLALAFLGLMEPDVARAQSGADTESERLVKEGQELLERGQVGAACDKLDLALKRADSVNTLALLAFCHEREGKPGRAWNEFKRVEPRAPTGDKAAFVAQHLKALEPKVARARLDVGSRTITEVRVDNELVLLDQGRVVADAGEHTIRVEAGGHVLTRNATLRVGDNPTIVMQAEASPPAAPPPVLPPALADDARARAPEESGGGRTAGWILTGVGVAFLGVGVATGVQTLKLKSDADQICGAAAPSCPGATLEQARAASDAAEAKKKEAITTSWFSTGGVILGAAGVVGGLYLLLSSGASSPAKSAGGVHVVPTVGLGAAGLSGWF